MKGGQTLKTEPTKFRKNDKKAADEGGDKMVDNEGEDERFVSRKQSTLNNEKYQDWFDKFTQTAKSLDSAPKELHKREQNQEVAKGDLAKARRRTVRIRATTSTR